MTNSMELFSLSSWELFNQSTNCLLLRNKNGLVFAKFVFPMSQPWYCKYKRMNEMMPLAWFSQNLTDKSANIITLWGKTIWYWVQYFSGVSFNIMRDNTSDGILLETAPSIQNLFSFSVFSHWSIKYICFLYNIMGI